MAYQYTDYSGYGNETDEETRRRRAMMIAGLGTDSTLGDIAGNMLTNRLDQAQNTIASAGNMLTNPEEELKKRMGAQSVSPIAPTVPTQQQVAQQARPLEQQLEQYKPVAPTPFDTRSMVPQTLPAQGTISANQPMPNIGQPPMPGPATTVAGPPVVQTQPPVVTAPAWVDAANQAGNDFNKLLDVAAKHPESRSFIQDKMKVAFASKTKEDEANQLYKDAAAGDLKAQNKIFQLIKPDTGKPKEEVTVSDYAKAILYKRLGLDAMAQDIQNKIIGKETKFGQVTVGGTNWATETDPSGNIIRARDDEGNYATEATLNKLRAGGQKFGTQAFGFTGESAVIPEGQPDAGQEYRQRTNAISGAIENVITSGPNIGKTYAGPPGASKSVGTQFSKALNQAFVDYQSKPTLQMANTMMELAGKVDSGDGRTIANTMARIRQMTPGIFNQITSGQAGTPPAPTSAVTQPGAPVTAPVRPGAVSTTPTTATTPGARPAATGGGGSLLAQSTQIPASIETAEQTKRAELKPPAEERGKQEAKSVAKQGFADSTYPLLQAVRQEISNSTGSKIGAGVDELARVVGASTKGQEAIAKLNVLAGPIKMNIPRFEGAQSDRDVQEYARQAGDFANPKLPIKERLAALDAMETLLAKYDKAGNNDWTYGRKSTAEPGTTSSGNKYKRVQ